MDNSINDDLAKRETIQEHMFRRDLHRYLIGFQLALLLTILAFWVALGGGQSFGLGRPVILGVVGGLGVLQLVVHLRYFLHIDLSREKREDLDVILFSTLVLLLVVLGTVWVLGDLAARMHMSM